MIERYKQIQHITQQFAISGTDRVSNSAQEKTRQKSYLSPFMLQLAETMGIKFSKHALDRIRFRKIDFGEEHLLKLSEGIEKLRKKGVKEGVVVMDDIIAVVGVKEGTVITVKTPPFKKDGVFSQIDGVVFV